MAAGITIDFNANLARFTSSIDKATSDLSKFQSNADRMSKNVSRIFGALGVGLSVGAVVAFGKSVIDTADNLGKAAEKAGITVEKFSALNYAAEQSEVSTSDLSKSLKFLNSAIVGNDKVLGALGVSVKNASGELRGADVVFLDFAEAISKLPDGAIKSEAIIKVLGKTGLETTNLLNQGKGGITAFTDEAKRMGLELSGETAKAADEFNDNLGRMKGTLIGIANEALPPLLEGLKKLNDFFGVGSKSLESGDFYKGLIKKNQDEIKTLNLAREDFINQPEFRGAILDEKVKYRQGRILEYAKLLDEVLQKEIKAITPKAKPLNTAALETALGGGDNGAEKAAEAKIKRLADTKKIQYELVKSNNEYVKSLQDKANALGLTEKQTALYELSQKTLTSAQRDAAAAAIESIEIQKDMNDALSEWEIQARTNAAIIANNQSIEESPEVAEQRGSAATLANLQMEMMDRNDVVQDMYLHRVEIIRDALAQELITHEQAQKDILKLTERNIELRTDAEARGAQSRARFAQLSATEQAGIVLEGFSRVLEGAGRTNKKMFEQAKIFGIASAVVNTAIGASKAIASYQPPLSFVMAGLQVAAGLIHVNTIRNSRFSGQAHDGLENVPKTGTYLLEGGERVVKKEDNKRLEKFLDGGNSGGNVNITFEIRGRDAPSASAIVASQRGQIINIIQGAYNDRLSRGGPLR